MIRSTCSDQSTLYFTPVTFRHIWERLTSTRSSRTLEAEILRERADVVRLRNENDRMRADLLRQQQEIARERSENVRLRDENRALLNSILGIAGIPPILVPAPLPESLVADARDFVIPGDDPTGAGNPSSDSPHAPAKESTMNSNPDLKPASDKPNSPAPHSSLFASPRIRRTPNSAGADSSAAVHTRRRSWHQINRRLEFESARKPVTGE